LVALLPLAVVAHVLFAGDRPLDSKMTISCDKFTGKAYREAFYDGWRITSDTAACDHCQGLAEGPCDKFPVTFIYCPSNSLVISAHDDSYGVSLVDLCI
jgi:hypothetical protein